MSPPTPAPLYLLAIDHRRSFERLFGVVQPVDPATYSRLAAAKVTVVDALAAAVAERAELQGVGILLDDHYGADAIEAAGRAGLAVAVAFERSSQAVLQFEHEDWRERVAGLVGRQRPRIAKVLVRHRADDDANARSVQLGRLREISDACRAAGVGFLLEVLTPFDDTERAGQDNSSLENELRPRLAVAAIGEIQAAGVEPTVWKVEGVSNPAGCAVIAAAARAGGRDRTGVVVLGAGAGRDTVSGWLRSAAEGGYTGFAVGRSIWADPLHALDTGDIDAAEARHQIVANYLEMVDTYSHAADRV